MTKSMARKELYDLIWAKPMTKASQELGLSDVGLKKICVKHEIPTPKMGHWAKKAHGKKVRQTPLRPPSDPKLEQIKIHGSNFSKLSSDLQKKISFVENKKPSANSNEDIPLYKVFSKTIKKLESKKPDSSGIINLIAPKYISCSIGANSAVRVTRFLRTLHTAIHRANITVVAEEKDILLQFDGETFPFSITEKLDRRPHENTELEQSKLDRWEQERKSGDWISLLGRPQVPEWDYFPSGKLVFKIEYNGYDGLRRTFSDAKIQTLESVLPDIIQGIQTCAISKKHNREKHEKQAREWELQREQRERIRQLNALEGKRVNVLSEYLTQWQQANQLRELLDNWKQKRASDGQPSPDELEWLNWANAYIDKNDPTNQVFPKLLQLEDFSPWELRD